jgi:D-alanyl-D-alanine carboxypeptidase
MTNRPRHKTKLRTALAALSAFAVIAAACGGDDADDADAVVDEVTEDADLVVVQPDEAALQALLDDWRIDADAFGATLSLRVPGHDDIHLASGVDDRDPDMPMPTDGTYAVGSVTKTFVAAAIMRLVDEGRLSLDDTIESWLPEVPAADQISIEMLLGHTAGLGNWRDSDDYIPTILADPTRSFAPEEVLERHLEVPAASSPGDDFFYSDAHYTSLGLILERELEQDLADVLANQFIEPLSLDDTVFGDGTTRQTRHGWFSLDGDPDRPLDTLDSPATSLTTTVWAAGNMLSSSADLLIWGEALYSGEVLGDAITDTMIDMRNEGDSPTWWNGLGTAGFCLGTASCPDEVELVGHGGVFAGGNTFLVHHRDSGVTLAIHANVGPPWISQGRQVELARRALDTLGIDAGEPDPCPDGFGSCQGPLEAGTYTSSEFEPTFSYTVPDGWENFGDVPDFFDLFAEDEVEVDGAIVLARSPAAMLSGPDQGSPPEPDEDVGRSAEELADWLTAHPELETGDPEPVTVGGLDGVQLDIGFAPASTSTTDWCEEGNLCVNLFSEKAPIDDSWGLGLFGLDHRVRVILLTTADGAGTVLIWLEGDDAEAFFEAAQPVVDSIDFGG